MEQAPLSCIVLAVLVQSVWTIPKQTWKPLQRLSFCWCYSSKTILRQWWIKIHNSKCYKAAFQTLFPKTQYRSAVPRSTRKVPAHCFEERSVSQLARRFSVSKWNLTMPCCRPPFASYFARLTSERKELANAMVNKSSLVRVFNATMFLYPRRVVYACLQIA